MTLSLVLRPVFSLRVRCFELAEKTARPIYTKLLKRNMQSWGHTMETLRAFPAGTVGRDIFVFLSQNGLELMPGLEDHDVFHVLFEFEPTVYGEIMLQAVVYGNGRRTLYTKLAVLFGWLIFPEFHADFYKNYRKGKQYKAFHRWNYQYLLLEKTADLRAFVTNSDKIPELNSL
ncbi:MAG: hypothetical protein WCR52_09205 [Bacteroidota bacterium]